MIKEYLQSLPNILGLLRFSILDAVILSLVAAAIINRNVKNDKVCNMNKVNIR